MNDRSEAGLSPDATDEDRVVDAEIEGLVHAIERRWGYDFTGYSRASLQRRVLGAVRDEGVESISELQAVVLRDPLALERFVSHLSVGVTSMFRDPEFYLALRRKVVPILRTWPFVRVWHAGCSTGEEVYSMAILLEEEGVYDRCRLYATDLSTRVIDRARTGVLPLRDMRHHTRNYLEAGGTQEFSSWYASGAHVATLDPALRRNIVFGEHNLVSDDVFNEFHLILCRNVMIYFRPSLRDRVHELLLRSLARFGVLALGMRETVLHTPVADRYTVLDPEVRLFRRRT